MRPETERDDALAAAAFNFSATGGGATLGAAIAGWSGAAVGAVFAAAVVLGSRRR